MARWELLLETRAGLVVGAFGNPIDIKYTRQENDFCQIEFRTLDVYDLNLVAANVHNRRIKAYRDGVLVFRGPIDEPLKINQDGAQIVARDYFAQLSANPSEDTATYNATVMNIALDVLDLNNVDMIEVDTALNPGSAVERKIKDGQRIDEFLKSMASSNPTSGYWFRIDAQEDNTYPNIMRWYSYSGRVDNAQARFEYGSRTLDNCQAFEVETRRVVNRVRVVGKGVSATVEDLASQGEYGVRKKIIRRPGVDHAPTATAIASKHLAPTPYTIGSFEPGPNAPKLFDDYDVGDKCRAYFVVGKLAYTASDMIPSRVEVTVDANGTENVAWGDDIVANRSRRRHLRKRAASSARFRKGKRG